MPLIKINENTSKERIIGYLDNCNRIFRKSVHKSRHLFLKLDAWGVDGAFFRDVLQPNNYKIQVWEREENAIYEVNAEKFAKKGQYYHFKKDKGDDHLSQIFLSRRHWEKLKKVDQEVRDCFLKYLA